MKRSLTERMARKFPCYRKKCLRRANYRRHIAKLKRRARKLYIELRTAPKDEIRGIVNEIAAISMTLSFIKDTA